MKATEKKSKNRQLSGIVVSTKMKDTIVVEITRYAKHPKYRKYLTSTTRLKAHDAGNTKKEGEKVTIVECRPMSKDKHFRVSESKSEARNPKSETNSNV